MKKIFFVILVSSTLIFHQNHAAYNSLSLIKSNIDLIEKVICQKGHKIWFYTAAILFLAGALKYRQKEALNNDGSDKLVPKDAHASKSDNKKIVDVSFSTLLKQTVGMPEHFERISSRISHFKNINIPKNKIIGLLMMLSSFYPVLFGYLHKIAYKSS